MSTLPKISLEQWRALVAVVDAGGYAQAAARLHKSQSAISYAVQRIEHLLGLKAFEIQGRRAVLTAAGQLLVQRAQALLDEAGSLENAAAALAAGWEPSIRLLTEHLFPNRVLLTALDRFGAIAPQTRIELIESVKDGTTEALLDGRAELAIAAAIPPGFFGEFLLPLRFLPLAHPDHPLHQLGRPLTAQDLRRHRHLVVRDTSSKRDPAQHSIEAKQRWVVSHMSTSIQAATLGYGFAWFPVDKVQDEIARGLLKPLPLREGGERRISLYLIFADREAAGPGTRRLAEILLETVGRACAWHQAEQAATSAAVAAASQRRPAALSSASRGIAPAGPGAAAAAPRGRPAKAAARRRSGARP